MNGCIEVAFFSTFKLERIRLISQALDKHKIQLSIVDINSRNPFSVILQLWKRSKHEILITHDWLMFPSLMALLNVLGGNQYVLISNSLVLKARMLNDWSKWRIFIYQKLFELSLKRCHANVCNSNYLKNELDSTYPQYSRKTIVIYNGVETPENKLSEFNYPDSPNFLTITNFEYKYKYEGLYLILDALTMSDYSNIKLYILGKVYSDRGFENLRFFNNKLVQQYGSLNVEVVPNADVFSYFQPDRAVFLYSSGPKGDSLPRAILEAQAMGMPTIVTNVTGCAEAVIPDKSAIVVNPDVDSLVNCIMRIMSADIDRYEMGELAKYNIQHNFTWSKMGAQYANVFRSAAENV